MVKCPGKLDDGESCGSELEEGTRFCGECGLKIDQSIFKKRTIQCHGTLEEGGPCGEIIQEGKRFCQKCGWKVDQTLFQIKEKRCGNIDCGAVLPDTANFCEECGTRVKTPLSDASKQISLTQSQEEIKRKPPEILTQDKESRHEQETDQTTSDEDVPDKNHSGKSDFESTVYKSSDVETLNDGEDPVETDEKDVIRNVSVHEEDIGMQEGQNKSIQKDNQDDDKESQVDEDKTDGNRIENDGNEEQSQTDKVNKHFGKGKKHLHTEDYPNPVNKELNKCDERKTEENGGINQEDKEQNQTELPDYHVEKGQNQTPVNEDPSSKDEGNIKEVGGQNQEEERQSQKNDDHLNKETNHIDTNGEQNESYEDCTDEDQGHSHVNVRKKQSSPEEHTTSKERNQTDNEGGGQIEKDESSDQLNGTQNQDIEVHQVEEVKKQMDEKEFQRSSREDEGKNQIESIQKKEHQEGQEENQEDGRVDPGQIYRREEQNKDDGQHQLNQRQNQGGQKYHDGHGVNEMDGQNQKDPIKNNSHDQRQNEVDHRQRQMTHGQNKGIHEQNQVDEKQKFENGSNGRRDLGATSGNIQHGQSASNISRSDSLRRQGGAAGNISRKSSMKTKEKDAIEVTFHAIESIDGDVDGHGAIAIQLKLPAYMHYQNRQPYHQMKYGRDIQDTENKGLTLGRVVELKIQLKKDQLLNGIQYNYHYYHKKARKEDYWREEQTLQNKMVFRKLEIPPETLKHYDQWHVYDGYIYKGKQGKEKRSYIPNFIQKWISGDSEPKHVQRLKTDGFSALDTFLFPLLYPSMKTSAIKEAFDKISMINYGSLRLHFPSTYAMAYDEDEFKRWLYISVVERRIDSIQSIESKRGYESKIISVLLVIHMAVELDLYRFLEDRQNNLFVKLQLEPNVQEETCEIFNTIKDICQTSIRTIKQSLQCFIRHFANCNVQTKYYDPSWLNALPLLHLLENRCSPFQRLQLVGTDPDSAKWWGSEGFEEVYNSIKASSGYHNWRRDPLDTLNGISRYCTLDPFLPRTFMAILRTSQIGAVIEKGIIPIEVSCACLSYHIRSIVHHSYHEEIISITIALIAVSHQLSECTRRFLRTGKTDHVLAEEIAYAAEIIIKMKKMLHQSEWQMLVEITET